MHESHDLVSVRRLTADDGSPQITPNWIDLNGNEISSGHMALEYEWILLLNSFAVHFDGLLMLIRQGSMAFTERVERI